jgi:hypothetical protein
MRSVTKLKDSAWTIWLRCNKHIPEVRTVMLFDRGKHCHCLIQLDVWERGGMRDKDTLRNYREALDYVLRRFKEDTAPNAGFRRAEDMVPVNDCGGFMRTEHVYGDDWNEVVV